MLELASLGLGALQTIMGLSGLNKLHDQPDPKFYETPEMQASRLRANQRSQYGFSPEENAAWENKLNRSENTGYQRTLDVAPTQARAVLAGTTYNNADAIGSHAASDAQRHQQNIAYSDKFSNELQSIADKNIQMQARNRLLAEERLGGAVSSGLGNITNTLNLAQVTGGFDKNKNPLVAASANPADPNWFKKTLNPAYNSVAPYRQEGVNAIPYADQSGTGLPADQNEGIQNVYDMLSKFHGHDYNPFH